MISTDISGVFVADVFGESQSLVCAAQERSESARVDGQTQCANRVNPEGTSVN